MTHDGKTTDEFANKLIETVKTVRHWPVGSYILDFQLLCAKYNLTTP